MREIFPVESGILGFGIWNTALGIRNSSNDWNPESKFHSQRIRNPEAGVRNPRSGIQNPRLSGIPFHGARSGFVLVIIEIMSLWERVSLSIIDVFFPCSLPF